VPVRVEVGGESVEIAPPPRPAKAPAPYRPPPFRAPPAQASGRTRRVPLSRLCLARSGDKGDTANIGVIARSPAAYAWALANLTPAYVKERFAGVCKGEVERFEVPNLLALNFLLHQSLGGGGTLSLLLDAQGKTYAQYLLAAEFEVDEALLED